MIMTMRLTAIFPQRHCCNVKSRGMSTKFVLLTFTFVRHWYGSFAAAAAAAAASIQRVQIVESSRGSHKPNMTVNDTLSQNAETLDEYLTIVITPSNESVASHNVSSSGYPPFNGSSSSCCSPLLMNPAMWNTSNWLLVIMFLMWIFFALCLVVFCACAYCRRRPDQDEVYDFGLMTHAQAQRMSKVIQRKWKLVALLLENTKMVVTKECFLVEIDIPKTSTSLQRKDKKEENLLSLSLEILDDKEDTSNSIVHSAMQKISTSLQRKQANEENLSMEILDDKEATSNSIVDSTVILIDGLDEDNYFSSCLFLRLDEYKPETMEKYPNGGPRQVPNSCAICLDSYDVGDHISWSANVECSHAFHHLCILSWCRKIMKEQPATDRCACPCCRQDFVKLDSNNEDGEGAESEAAPANLEGP